VQAATDESRISRVRNPFRHVIVFVIGGGTFVEYQNLKDYERKSNEKVCLRRASATLSLSLPPAASNCPACPSAP
jgi:hypothetical protein